MKLNFGNPLTRGLIAYWPFDERAGAVARDRTGRINNGTISGGTWGAERLQLTAASSEYIYIDSIGGVGTGQGTVFALFRFDSYTNYKPLFYLHDSSDNNMMIIRLGTSNNIQWLGYNTSGTAVINQSTTASTVYAGNWYVFVCTWDSSSAYFYQDSIIIGSDTSIAGTLRNCDKLRIGNNYSTTYTDCTIQCFGYYNIKLSHNQVARLSADVHGLMKFPNKTFLYQTESGVTAPIPYLMQVA